ncbi:hypothetical protein BGAL_0311g00240 [Botrytis galanthina]|uniref:Uncharacterized protein n=1 Tax=Botrytis galanthina TaxID=278940 RepID=A0A4S8QQL0_9HELO|nr:hypothetical protein BGAL_0311g00240 [Botrytis galanthina]
MKPKNNEVARKNAGQMSGSQVLKAVAQQSTQSTNTITQTQYAIREHQKQIEEFQIKIHKHVQQVAGPRKEEQALLEKQTLFEVEKIQHELCDIDKGNKQREVEEEKHKNMMAKQILYEGEF